MFAGPSDAEPKALVEQLISDSGSVPTYVGPIRYARNLEVSAGHYMQPICPNSRCMLCVASHKPPSSDMYSRVAVACFKGGLTDAQCRSMLSWLKFLKGHLCVLALQALAEMWIHLAVAPAGFTQENYGPLFTFQLQQKQ